MLRAGALLCLLSTVLALDGSFLDKYAFTKVMQHCLGTANYYRQLSEVAQAKTLCLGYPQKAFLTPSGLNYYFSDRRTQHLAGGPLWDANTLATAATHLNAALSNFTCVMEFINAIDAELHVNQESFVNHYFWTTEDDYLKTDLIKNIYFCKEASDGLPLERDHSPLHARLHRLMFFLKCEKKKRLAACLKHDLRANLDDDLSGLPGSDSRREAVSEVLALLVGADGINNLDLYG